MVDYCLKCKSEMAGMMHLCLGHKVVFDAVAYREELRTSNPLDRLTLEEVMKISGEDVDAAMRRAEEFLEISNARYFQSPLLYRVEFESTAAAPGFRGAIDGSAILTEGHADKDWTRVLEFINTTGSKVFLLNENEKYLCRLVSYNNEGIKYMWALKELQFQKGTGWAFSEYN